MKLENLRMADGRMKSLIRCCFSSAFSSNEMNFFCFKCFSSRRALRRAHAVVGVCGRGKAAGGEEKLFHDSSRKYRLADFPRS